MQLHPREKFIIVRQLQNPYITDTFYVRAVIRNSRTDATIATLNLENQTGQRFTKEWLVPADPSGLGFPISIVTSVYTDSGYTTKSQNYGDEENTYIVQDRYIFNPNYPVGADIDYKRIKKMIDDAVKNIVIPQPLEQKVVTVTKEVVKEVRVPEVKIVETSKPLDVKPILSAIAAISDKVDGIEFPEIPEQKEVDLSSVVSEVAKLAAMVKSGMDKVDSSLKSASVKSTVKDSLKKIMESLDGSPEEKDDPKKDPRITRLMKK